MQTGYVAHSEKSSEVRELHLCPEKSRNLAQFVIERSLFASWDSSRKARFSYVKWSQKKPPSHAYCLAICACYPSSHAVFFLSTLSLWCIMLLRNRKKNQGMKTALCRQAKYTYTRGGTVVTNPAGSAIFR